MEGANKVIPVKVALRIRPLVPMEIREGCQSVLDIVEGEPQVNVLTTRHSFTYDYAYDGNNEQEEVYDNACKPLLEKLFKGFNVTVLAYGQTGSGKTHTMGTAYKSYEDPEKLGIIPRAVDEIFQRMTTNESTEFLVKVSFLELYNEQLFDLLAEKSKREDTIVDIREDGTGIKIPGLTEVTVGSTSQTMNILERASEGRITAATAMNLQSSRSHAIFTLSIEARSNDGNATVSKFHMVDLAGSERQKKTKAKGVRLKEGININMGLLALGNVISALGEDKKSSGKHIPYRDSKLTRLLQDSLGGNSHTLMIACVSPADKNVDETISTLRYADRARKIKNKPTINQNPRDAEIGRLRQQVQELQLKVLQAGGVCNANTSQEQGEVELMRSAMARLEEENQKLTSALQSAMDENAHMSEKLLLSEQVQESLKNRMQELCAQAEETMRELPSMPLQVREKMESLKQKVESVHEQQKLGEKTMLEHEMSRFNPREISMDENTENNTSTDNPDNEDSPQEDQDIGGATYALRQSELTNQLQELNKVLLAKQELAEKIGVNDAKMNAMKKKYEDTVKQLEEEIGKLQVEKDQLMQQQRNAGAGAASLTGGAGNKVSEQRRKRIQELETQINGLKKQQTEQQRLAKLNQQNELKVKKLAEEIRTMKANKVKLIKQMKEESEKVRHWKLVKEKEVLQLKQKDRKAQFQMAKMERLHERQQHVLRRKMEETVAVNKRLKDALEKKAQARAQKAGNKDTLVGSGERVRNWISSELDVVVSAKEAEKSRKQLLEDRKELSAKFNKLKCQTRRTMTQDERDEVNRELADLQQELDLRNSQLADLQSHIISFNEDKEKDKSGDRWARLASMVEAKIAAQYLFDTATEIMATAALKKSEVKELRSQLDEINEIRESLQEEMKKLKVNHEDEMVRLEREYEEKILFLLRQLPSEDQKETKSTEETETKDSADSLAERLKFQAAEIAKMSDLHDALLAKEQEVASLKEELMSANVGGDIKFQNLLEGIITPTNKGQAKKKQKKVTIAVERYEEDEILSSSEEDPESDESDEGDDPEWRNTPMYKRIKKERQSIVGFNPKRKRLSSEINEDDESIQSSKDDSKRRRASNVGCTCKQGCKNKRCSCKKEGGICSGHCKCDPDACANRDLNSADTTSGMSSVGDITRDQSIKSEVGKENDKTSDLLDTTFEFKANFTARSPLKNIFSNNRGSLDMFADTDTEATPNTRRSSSINRKAKSPHTPSNQPHSPPNVDN